MFIFVKSALNCSNSKKSRLGELKPVVVVVQGDHSPGKPGNVS